MPNSARNAAINSKHPVLLVWTGKERILIRDLSSPKRHTCLSPAGVSFLSLAFFLIKEAGRQPGRLNPFRQIGPVFLMRQAMIFLNQPNGIWQPGKERKKTGSTGRKVSAVLPGCFEDGPHLGSLCIRSVKTLWHLYTDFFGRFEAKQLLKPEERANDRKKDYSLFILTVTCFNESKRAIRFEDVLLFDSLRI